MKLLLTALIAMLPTVALASHGGPGERTWQSWVNGNDCTVNPKCHRLRFRRQIRSANRPIHPFNSDFGTINDFRHVTS